MDKEVARLFADWGKFTQNAGVFFGHLHAMFADMDVAPADVKIFAFVSSARKNEIRYYCSNGASTTHTSPLCIGSSDEEEARRRLATLFQIEKTRSTFNIAGTSLRRQTYDEFGVLSEGDTEICWYGTILEYNGPNYPNTLLTELLGQVCAYCKTVMDDAHYAFDEHMIPNLVYASLKKRINIDFFNTLSASDYEKTAAVGSIQLVPGDQPCKLTLRFEETFPLEIGNVRQIRKLLEMSGNGLFLIAKNGEIVGLGPHHKDSAEFQFNGHQHWTYCDDSKALLHHKKGKYAFVTTDEQSLKSDFPQGFISWRHARHLNTILGEIKRHKHGTLLIISDAAAAEVARLCKLNRGYAINPIDLKRSSALNLLSRITRIDGAIFLDTKLVCHGIGIILDGIAVKSGLSSRGARYNSARCYIDNKPPREYVAVVISDDETTDTLYNGEEK